MTIFSALPIILLLSACQAGEPPDAEVAMTRNISPPDSIPRSSWLSHYDLKEKNPLTFKVSNKLNEMSGLAATADGRLFAHDDEDPIVYVLSYTTGEILKRFTVGSGFMEEDFEGIAVKKDTLFLVTSSGDLFAFQETGDREHADFQLYRTFLSEKNDVEGLEYDPATDCLLLACKGDPGKGYGGYKAVYAFSLKTRTLQKDPRFLIPLKDAGGRKRKGSFSPSGIAFHPDSGTFFIISADDASIMEIDQQGTILDQEEIPVATNSQPEGIVFLPDGSMLIANDGQGGAGAITVYPARAP